MSIPPVSGGNQMPSSPEQQCAQQLEEFQKGAKSWITKFQEYAKEGKGFPRGEAEQFVAYMRKAADFCEKNMPTLEAMQKETGGQGLEVAASSVINLAHTYSSIEGMSALEHPKGAGGVDSFEEFLTDVRTATSYRA